MILFCINAGSLEGIDNAMTEEGKWRMKNGE